jgi:hypothetical protein
VGTVVEEEIVRNQTDGGGADSQRNRHPCYKRVGGRFRVIFLLVRRVGLQRGESVSGENCN